MLEDKIQHNIIKINQLTKQGEDVRYIIPLYYTAVKYAYEHSAQMKVNPAVLENLASKYQQFRTLLENISRQLDQVHLYMLEETTWMLGSKHFQSYQDSKRSSKIASPRFREDEQKSQLDQNIYLQQEEERLDQWTGSVTSDQFPIKSTIIRPISLDDVPNFQLKFRDADVLWKSVVQLYKNHQIDEAHEECDKYQNATFLSNPNCKLPSQRIELIQSINKQYKLMNHFYQYFQQPGYVFDKQDKGVKMYYKVYEETKEVSIRIEAEISIPIENFLCIVSEVDLFQQFVPFAYETREIKKVSRNEKIGTTKVYIPLISNRQAYFYAAAYDRLKTKNSIFFFSKTISSDIEYQNRYGVQVPKDSDLVELEYKFYILEYQPVAAGRGKIRLATNTDLKLQYLPLFVLNKTARIFAFDYFKNLVKANKHFSGSKWQKKMKEKPQLYDYFKKRIQQYLASIL